MIGDDHFEPDLAGTPGRIAGSDAAVDRDQQSTAFFVNLLECRSIEAVTFFEAVGDVEINVGVGEAQDMPQNGARGDAIDIVIAVNNDLLAVANCAGDALRRRFGTGQRVRFVQIGELGLQKRPGLRDVGDIAIVQELGDQR